MSEQEQSAANEAAESNEFETAFAEFAAASNDVDQQEHDDQEAAPLKEPESTEQQATEADKPVAEVAPTQPQIDWEHRYRSEVGRQAALQRKVQELSEQLQATPKPQQPKQLSDRMKRLMGDFPEIAEAMQEELESRIGEVRNEFQQEVQPFKAKEQEQVLRQAEVTVEQKYPTFKQTVNSQEFVEWFQQQPASVQALAGSPHARDAVAMLDYFTATTRPNPPATNPEVAGIKAKREQALQRNVSVRNTAPAPVADGPDSFEDAFAFYAKQKERQNARFR